MFLKKRSFLRRIAGTAIPGHAADEKNLIFSRPKMAGFSKSEKKMKKKARNENDEKASFYVFFDFHRFSRFLTFFCVKKSKNDSATHISRRRWRDAQIIAAAIYKLLPVQIFKNAPMFLKFCPKFFSTGKIFQPNLCVTRDLSTNFFLKKFFLVRSSREKYFFSRKNSFFHREWKKIHWKNFPSSRHRRKFFSQPCK